MKLRFVFFFFIICVVFSSSCSDAAAEAAAVAAKKLADAPSPPTNLRVVRTGYDEVDFEWDGPKSDDEIQNSKIEYYLYKNDSDEGVVVGPRARYTQERLTPGRSYRFRVRSKYIDNNAFSQYSNVVSVTPVIPSPTNFRITAVGSEKITLEWSSKEDLDTVIYKDGELVSYVSKGKSIYKVSFLTPGTSYSFTVRARKLLSTEDKFDYFESADSKALSARTTASPARGGR